MYTKETTASEPDVWIVRSLKIIMLNWRIAVKMPP